MSQHRAVMLTQCCPALQLAVNAQRISYVQQGGEQQQQTAAQPAADVSCGSGQALEHLRRRRSICCICRRAVREQGGN
jgi:hypothetical protein